MQNELTCGVLIKPKSKAMNFRFKTAEMSAASDAVALLRACGATLNRGAFAHSYFGGAR